MNELYVRYSYIYFKTKETDVKTAMDRLIREAEKAGIELIIEEAVLRDENDDDIENWSR